MNKGWTQIKWENPSEQKMLKQKNCNVDYRNLIGKGKSTVENARLEKDNDCSKHINAKMYVWI